MICLNNSESLYLLLEPSLYLPLVFIYFYTTRQGDYKPLFLLRIVVFYIL